MSTHIFQIESTPNRTTQSAGVEFLYFSGTSYLGMSQNEQFKALIMEGVAQMGASYGSSRNSNVELGIYGQAEAQMAALTTAPAALLTSSGMLAGQCAVRQLMLDGYTFHYSPDVHPAVWHLPSVDIPKISFEEWTTNCVRLIAKNQKICLVTNAVDALRGKIHDFDWIDQLPAHGHITLLIDDSHGMGISGPNGAGVRARVSSKPNIRLIVTASLHKALGLPGGVILADAQSLGGMKQSAFFSGASPQAPAYFYAFLKAQHLYAEARANLARNALLFHNLTKDLNLFVHKNDFPVYYTERDDLAQFLRDHGIIIYSFAYPNPNAKPITRIVISAWHRPEDIEKLAHLCQMFSVKMA